MKRLRKHFSGQEIRFYMCGEYGPKLDRPHYHACLFGITFADMVRHGGSGKYPVFRSADLERIWGLGFTTIAAVNAETAGYTARYVMKKLSGTLADAHYRRVCAETGEIFDLQPEFNHMSLRPGIGSRFFDRFYFDMFPHGKSVLAGKEVPLPKYYLRRLETVDPDLFDRLKDEAQYRSFVSRADSTHQRLAVREKVARARVSTKRRSMENR